MTFEILTTNIILLYLLPESRREEREGIARVAGILDDIFSLPDAIYWEDGLNGRK